MPLAASLLPEFDHEMANTRTTLSRVPMDKADWTPHERSGSFQWLAWHLAILPMWATETVRSSELDMDNSSVEIPEPPDTTEELLALCGIENHLAIVGLDGQGIGRNEASGPLDNSDFAATCQGGQALGQSADDRVLPRA